MKNVLLTALLLMPALATAQAYKCTIDGVTKYQSSPCAKNPESAPLELKIPSEELQAKMRDQERQRDQYWVNHQKAEAEKQQAIAAAERDRITYEMELERERQVINTRRDQLWNEHEVDRTRYEQDRKYECSKKDAKNNYGAGC
ncbi:MAG: hypothetical protein ABL933_19030 [Methyloglobulus sp.]|nr:hypothetical protein [Methyloglobulus sp.]